MAIQVDPNNCHIQQIITMYIDKLLICKLINYYIFFQYNIHF